MNNIKIAGLALLAVAPLSAQVTTFAYSPPGLSNKEGGYYSYYLGAYHGPRARTQLGDGELRNTVMSVKEIAFRLDYRSHSAYSAVGRTFQKVTIDMCDTDVTNMVTTFSMNQKSTPTRVFSSSITWPTLTGYPLTKPALWGGTTGALKFPFNKGTWLTLGQKDILSDWTFSGGTLANGYTWTTTSSRTYYLDGWQALSPTGSISGTAVYVPTTRLNNNSGGVTGRCNDSASTYTTGSYMYSYCYIYGKYYSSTHWRDRMRIYSYTYYTAYDAPIIHAIGLLPDVKGVDLGTGCNKLHMNPASIAVMMTGRTVPKQYNVSGYSGYLELVTPYSASWSGQTFAMQGAWADSKTGKLNLTQARHLTIPNAAPEPKHACVRSYSTYGPYGPYTYYYYNPPRRYGY